MELKDLMLKQEKFYSKYASKDQDAIRLKPYEPDIRPNYFRDIDRIIYSSTYTRYMDKTQVFSFANNDNISKRMVHVQLVSKIARTIGRVLSLNEDLIEAIALGHDLGHVPFGHIGEKFLNEISLKHNEGYFMHNVQSVRFLMDVGERGNGKNLCLQVLDGILCHNGELELKEYKPNKKTKEEFLNDYNNCYKYADYTTKLVPMTLEGCIVRVSDLIAYLGRDIEDAEKLGVIQKEDIPKEITDVLGSDNKSIVNTFILDIINNSLNKPYIKLSENVFMAMKSLKKFNYENIYNKAMTKEQKETYKEMFNYLYDKYLEVLNNHVMNDNIYRFFLNKMTPEYLQNTNERIAIDYIAGMTDDYFVKEYKKYQEQT